MTKTNVIKGLLKQAVQNHDPDDVLNAVVISHRTDSGFDWNRHFKSEWYTATIEQLMRLRDSETEFGNDFESEFDEAFEAEQEGISWITAALR